MNLQRLLIFNHCEQAPFADSVASVRSPDELTKAFRARRLKVTPQRQLLFRLLEDNDRHPSADALFAEATLAMPGISLRTVYQTLNDLTAMGELQAIDVGGAATRFDPNVDDHHHVVCDRCGDVRDVYVDGVEALTISDETRAGFQVDRTQVVFRGVCARCAVIPNLPQQ
jgi:Fe2+ or Zn2+ uptake regulation protein